MFIFFEVNSQVKNNVIQRLLLQMHLNPIIYILNRWQHILEEQFVFECDGKGEDY